MSGIEGDRGSETKIIISPADNVIAFAEDVIEPGKAVALGFDSSGLISVMVLAEGVAFRTGRLLGEGKYRMGSISDLPPGSTFSTVEGEIVIVFNRGSSPIIKRSVTVDPQSEFDIE